MAVRTQPGSTALEVTPKGPASCATARASPISPALEAAHTADCQTRELEWSVEIYAHRLAPDLGLLLPYQLLMSRTDAVVDHQHIDRAQPSLRLRNGMGAALLGAEIRCYVFEADRREFRRGA